MLLKNIFKEKPGVNQAVEDMESSKVVREILEL
jgi:hypothetical protein